MSNTTPSNRLYGMMQYLLTDYAHSEIPTPAEDRGVVDEQDALDAVISLAAFLDANAQAGRISANDAEHMASMLMVIREHVRPLPPGLVETPDGGEEDGVTTDLRVMVDAIRTGREESGMRG